jgi:hypothetical protein
MRFSDFFGVGIMVAAFVAAGVAVNKFLGRK